MTKTAIYETEEEAIKYAKLKRGYHCKIEVIHKYEVEEIVYERMSL